MNANTLLIVAQQPLVRLGIRTFLCGLSGLPDGMVFLEADDMSKVPGLLSGQRPTLVVLSSAEVEDETPEWVRELRRQMPDLAVVVVMLSRSADLSRKLVDAGTLGLVILSDPKSELESCVHKVLAGKRYISGQVAEIVLGPASSRTGTADYRAVLSDREMEIFRLLGQGLSVDDIAKALDISAKTVYGHEFHMRNKLQLKSSKGVRRLAILDALK